MKISSKSWHYRFNLKIQGEKFEHKAECGRFTTCSYIRTCIASVIQGAWFAFLICIIAALAIFIVGSAIWVPISIFFLGGIPTGSPLAAACIVWALIALGLLVLMWKQQVRPYYNAKVHQEPNVFIQAIKDKHGKFCTRVELV